MTTPLTPDYLTGLSEMAYGPFDIGTANELIRALAAEVLRLRYPHEWHCIPDGGGIWQCRWCLRRARTSDDWPQEPCPYYPKGPRS